MKPRKITKRGQVRWLVESYVGQRRRRWTFASKAAAELKQAQLARDREGFGRVWLELEPRERAEVCTVLEAIRAKGLTIRQVWEAFEAHQLKARGQSVTVAEALERLATTQRTSNLRPNYIRDVARAVRQFTRGREQALVNQFTTADVEAFIAAGESPNTRATRRGRLLAFFSYCARLGWADNVVRAVAKVKVEPKPPVFFTPAQCRQLMALVEDRCPQALAWVSLALFAGVRPEDADRVSWQAVNLETGEFSLQAASSKKRVKATIKMTPNCLAWMIRAQERGARLPLSQSSRERCVKQLRNALGLTAWPAKVLRHTFCTYGQVLFGAQWVSQRARHSESVLFEHYANLAATELDAKEFFSIEPKENHERPTSGCATGRDQASPAGPSTAGAICS